MDEYIVGTCKQMCPAEEIARRSRENLIHVLETSTDINSELEKCKTDKSKMVKEFSRSAAGRQTKARDIRPPQVLKTTIIYLINKVLPRNNISCITVYDFIFDRIRAIRQDLVIQNCSNSSEYAFILETAVRFYIYFGYRLCEEALLVYDPHINNCQLQECLKLLLKYYLEHQNSPNYAEIISFYVLHNLHADEALFYAISLPRNLRSKKELTTTLPLACSWKENNFVRINRLRRNLPFFHACLFHSHLPSIQRKALVTMNAAFKTFPLDYLQNLLIFEDLKVATSTCRYYGLGVEKNDVHFVKKCIELQKDTLPLSRCEWINHKLRNKKIEEMILNLNS